MHISAYVTRAMKFVKLLALFRLTAYFVVFIKCEVVSTKVVFTNEPCNVKDESVFLPVSGNTGQYKQCGPAGYYWIFPCSPGTTFSETQKACARTQEEVAKTSDNQTSTTTTTTTAADEIRSLVSNKKTQIKANKNSGLLNSSNSKHTSSVRRQEVTEKPWSPDYYEGDEEFVEPSEQATTAALPHQEISTSIPTESYSSATTSIPTFESESVNRVDETNQQKPKPKEGVQLNLLKTKSPPVTGMPDPDTDLAQPDDSGESQDYYRYHVSTIRRTPASYQKSENLMIGATTKSQEVFESQSGHSPSAEAAHYWQGYEQHSQYNNGEQPPQAGNSQTAYQSHAGNNLNQKLPTAYNSKQSPANRPLSPGAQELAKVISEEDLETLSRVFQVLASQQGGGPVPGGGPPPGPVMLPPGVIPGGPPSGGPPMMPPSGFVPPVPESGGQPYNMIPPASAQNQMAQFYMIPPPFIQRPGTTEAPRLFKIVANCVENGTCSHEDNAETYCMHESDPVSYYQCSPGVDYGIWIVRQCPAGLHFNSDGECGKRHSAVGQPPSTGTRVQVGQPPDVPANVGGGGANVGGGGANVNIPPLPLPNVIWGPQPGESIQPETPPHYATLPPPNPYPSEIAVQTVTPESAYVSTNNGYPEAAVGETAGGSPPSPPNNLFYIKQPQIWEQPKVLSSPQIVPNQKNIIGGGNTLLYPGIQQTVNQMIPQQPPPFQPPRQIIGPKIQPGLIKTGPIIQPPRPPGGYPPPRPPVDQQTYQPVQTSNSVAESSISKGQPLAPVLPKQPIKPTNVRPAVIPTLPVGAQSNKENVGQVVQPPAAKSGSAESAVKTFLPKQVQIGEQFIQSPQVPLEFETAIPTLMPNGRPVVPPSTGVKNNQLNLIQQASQIYGGYPRYPEIPQLKTLTETAWLGRNDGVQSMPSAGGHPYHPPPQAANSAAQPSRPSPSLAATQTIIRPKANQNSQILIGNNQIRNNPLKMMTQSRKTPALKNDDAVVVQRDSPLPPPLDKRQRIQQAADLLFTNLVHQKLKVIESLAQQLTDRRILSNSAVQNFTTFNKRISEIHKSILQKNDRGQQQENSLQNRNNRILLGNRNTFPQTNVNYLTVHNRISTTGGQSLLPSNLRVASEKSLPYGMNYYRNGTSKTIVNNNNFNFYPIKSAMLQQQQQQQHGSPLLPKSVQKTQERDNANFSVPFWSIDEKSNYQPFVGQKCRLSTTKVIKPVKFNAKTFLVCQPNKKFNKGVTVGTWVLSSCPDNQIFDRLYKRCVKKFL